MRVNLLSSPPKEETCKKRPSLRASGHARGRLIRHTVSYRLIRHTIPALPRHAVPHPAYRPNTRAHGVTSTTCPQSAECAPPWHSQGQQLASNMHALDHRAERVEVDTRISHAPRIVKRSR